MDIQALFFEIIVIIIGVLCALFIDKLNEKRNHIKRINSIMKIVINNMKHDISIIDKIIQTKKSDDKLYQRYIHAKDLDDKLLIDCGNIPVTTQSFTAKVRGYNLLKDARVDFDFKNSELITDIVHHYNLFLTSLKKYELEIYDTCSKNIDEMTSFTWFDSVANHHINSKEYIDYIRTDQFKKQLLFMQFLKNHYCSHLLDYQNRTSILLKRSLESNYK